MKFLCLFGHTPSRAYYKGDGMFVKLGKPYFDCIGRAHRSVYATCDRCGEKYQIAVCIDAETKEPLT